MPFSGIVVVCYRDVVARGRCQDLKCLADPVLCSQSIVLGIDILLGAPTRKMPAEQLDQPLGIHSSGEAGLTLVRATFYGSEVVDIGAGYAGPFIFVIVKKLSR